MGGCATKPKVVKGDEVETPAPAPAPELTKETVPAATEAKEAADAEGEKKVDSENKVDEVVKAKDIDVDDTVKEVVDDDQARRQSLSNLFQEKENKGSEPLEQETAAAVQQDSSEPLKEESLEAAKEEQIEIEKLKHTSDETLSQETKKAVNTSEQTSEQDSVGATGKIETEKSIEAIAVAEPAPAAEETQNKETSNDVKEDKTEVAK